MIKNEIFSNLMDIVIKETGLTKNQIVSSCKASEIVDARYIIIYLLKKEGLYIRDISKMIGISRRGVEKIISQFENRFEQGGPMFKIMLKRISNKMRTYSDI